MNSKWYISTLFLILFICFGAFQEQVTIPNQEIVLEFVDGKINKTEVKNTIADVKEKLISIGVSNISIQETKAGKLTIAYYSAIPIDNIKVALAEEKELALDEDSENKQKQLPSVTYNIDIYELTNEVDTTNLNDKYVLEIKYISERSTTTQTIAALRNLEIEKANQLFKTAYSTYKNNPLTKDRTSYKEPEVRAGPDSYNS